MEPMLIVPSRLCLDARAAGEWCRIPYPGHPKGCPNCDSVRVTCPPNAPKVSDVYDLSKPVYFVCSRCGWRFCKGIL